MLNRPGALPNLRLRMVSKNLGERSISRKIEYYTICNNPKQIKYDYCNLIIEIANTKFAGDFGKRYFSKVCGQKPAEVANMKPTILFKTGRSRDGLSKDATEPDVETARDRTA